MTPQGIALSRLTLSPSDVGKIIAWLGAGLIAWVTLTGSVRELQRTKASVASVDSVKHAIGVLRERQATQDSAILWEIRDIKHIICRNRNDSACQR